MSELPKNEEVVVVPEAADPKQSLADDTRPVVEGALSAPKGDEKMFIPLRSKITALQGDEKECFRLWFSAAKDALASDGYRLCQEVLSSGRVNSDPAKVAALDVVADQKSKYRSMAASCAILQDHDPAGAALRFLLMARKAYQAGRKQAAQELREAVRLWVSKHFEYSEHNSADQLVDFIQRYDGCGRFSRFYWDECPPDMDSPWAYWANQESQAEDEVSFSSPARDIVRNAYRDVYSFVANASSTHGAVKSEQLKCLNTVMGKVVDQIKQTADIKAFRATYNTTDLEEVPESTATDEKSEE